jgi:MFS family permease
MKLTRLLVDIQPLRDSPAFRRLWAGLGLSSVGSQMTVFAVALQAYTLTNSSLAVGVVGLCSALPQIGFALIGGAIGDAVDRRTLVLVMSSGQAVVSVLFAVQAYAGLRQVWPLYALVVLQSLIGSVNAPARRTFMPRLLPRHQIPAGAALTMFTMHVSGTVGPVLAGTVTAAWGLKACYLVDAVTFLAVLYGVIRLPPMPPEGTVARPGARAVLDALRFIRANRIVTGAFLADLSITLLGMPFALFPAINAAHFGGGAQTLGLLNAAPAVGGVLGSALSGPVGRIARQGRGMLVACAVAGFATAGFGLARTLWVALALLVLAGTADVTAVVLRTTMVQVETPDRYRGRVGAAELVVGVAGPQLGSFRAGALGTLTTPAVSAVVGGLSTVVGALLVALAVPAFVRYGSSGEDVHRAGHHEGDGHE